jgi:hypothetical protein
VRLSALSEYLGTYLLTYLDSHRAVPVALGFEMGNHLITQYLYVIPCFLVSFLAQRKSFIPGWMGASVPDSYLLTYLG